MNSFEKVAWKSLTKNGSSGKESKSHLMELGAEKTLCGTVIPPQDQISEEHLNGECKRCATKAEKSVSQVDQAAPKTKAPAKAKSVSPVEKAAPKTKAPAKAKKAVVKIIPTAPVVKYAFRDWLNQLNTNETLPRGKFFKGKKIA